MEILRQNNACQGPRIWNGVLINVKSPEIYDIRGDVIKAIIKRSHSYCPVTICSNLKFTILVIPACLSVQHVNGESMHIYVTL